jgi:hypothetical protein
VDQTLSSSFLTKLDGGVNIQAHSQVMQFHFTHILFIRCSLFKNIGDVAKLEHFDGSGKMGTVVA